MHKWKYQDKTFRTKTLERIAQANQIIDEYTALGYALTLRQLYYQMVARDLLPNRVQEYKKLVKTITDARLAGLVAWDVIEDRTRPLRGNNHWKGPRQAIKWLRDEHYHIDKWRDQPNRLEVWIEKDALLSVIADVCEAHDVHYISTRGYPSATVVWNAAVNRMAYYLLAEHNQQEVVILHLADHDPSGLDMTRDLQERLDLFITTTWSEKRVRVERVALTMEQIELHAPPPNPAKVTDSRFEEYQWQHGPDSWELDALDPATITSLIEQEIIAYRDDERWEAAMEKENAHKEKLTQAIELVEE